MSAYLRAEGVAPVKIHAYPKRRRGFMNDAELQALGQARATPLASATSVVSPVAEIRPAGFRPAGIATDGPSYADFFAPARELAVQATA